MSGYGVTASPMVEVVQAVQRRRRTAAEKARMVEESLQAGMTVSSVARRHGVAPNLLFRWRKLMAEGGNAALAAGERVVSMAEVRGLKKQIRELERLLGKKTLQVEILREAVALAREKKLILRSPLPMEDDIL